MLALCFCLFFAMVAAALATGHSVAWALLGGLRSEERRVGKEC